MASLEDSYERQKVGSVVMQTFIRPASIKNITAFFIIHGKLYSSLNNKANCVTKHLQMRYCGLVFPKRFTTKSFVLKITITISCRIYQLVKIWERKKLFPIDTLSRTQILLSTLSVHISSSLLEKCYSNDKDGNKIQVWGLFPHSCNFSEKTTEK